MTLLVSLVLLALAADASSHGWAVVLAAAAFLVAVAGLANYLLERR